MAKPVWRTAARVDLRTISARIAPHDPRAAGALAAEIRAKVARLPEHPRLYRRGRVPGTREMVVRPNYLVIYTERDGTVTVLRVLHAAQQWP